MTLTTDALSRQRRGIPARAGAPHTGFNHSQGFEATAKLSSAAEVGARNPRSRKGLKLWLAAGDRYASLAAQRDIT